MEVKDEMEIVLFSVQDQDTGFLNTCSRRNITQKWIHHLTLSFLKFTGLYHMTGEYVAYIQGHRFRQTLKKCLFAVLLPTHPKQALPKKFIAFLRFFFSKCC